jgi:hypothetical protein
MSPRNLLVSRDGSSIIGDLREKSFTIATSLGRIKVKVTAIAWIHFKGTPATPKDELWLHNGDRLSGTIVGTALQWRDSSGDVHTVPYRKIHTISRMLDVGRGGTRW